MIKTAVIGASGFIGRQLLRVYRQAFPDCLGTAFSNVGPGLTPFDLRKPDLPSLRLEETGHQAVLIASAKPNIAYCEQQPTAAYAVNVTGTIELLRQIGRTSLSVIFLSSDYVFDGTKGSYADTDKVNPKTAYGRHKALIEREIPSLIENYVILRLSKVFGTEKNDATFLDELARTLAQGQAVAAAVDQFFCPIGVTELVRMIPDLQTTETRRLLNICNSEIWSRYDIALAMADALGADRSLVKKVSLNDIPALRGRPLNLTMTPSRLANGNLPSFGPLRDAIVHIASNWRGTPVILPTQASLIPMNHKRLRAG